jgi:hypothetical protein
MLHSCMNICTHTHTHTHTHTSTVKYTDDLVLLAKVEMMLQGMIHRLTKIGKCYEWK